MKSKMDFSSEPAEITRASPPELKTARAEPIRLNLPPRPLVPWLRLAHFTRTEPWESSTLGRKRSLLDFELVLQCEGSAWIWVETSGGSLDVLPGSIAFIPPGLVHSWSVTPGEHIAVHFDLHYQPDVKAYQNFKLQDEFVERQPVEIVPTFILNHYPGPAPAAPLILPLVTPLRQPQLWRERLERLVRIYQTQTQTELASQLLINEVLSRCLLAIAEDAAYSGLSPESTVEKRIISLLTELAVSKQTQLSITELAEKCGMSQTTFRQTFMRMTGRNPHQYFEQLRIERAAQLLLQTERTINSIAQAEGYDDPYHFSRVFKRVMGCSPYQFRFKGNNQKNQPF
jgi:AraC-like DNA-binding protein